MSNVKELYLKPIYNGVVPLTFLQECKRTILETNLQQIACRGFVDTKCKRTILETNLQQSFIGHQSTSNVKELYLKPIYNCKRERIGYIECKRTILETNLQPINNPLYVSINVKELYLKPIYNRYEP